MGRPRGRRGSGKSGAGGPLRKVPFDLPDLTGKVVLVTGANRGLGFETARRLAAQGAHTVLACRDQRRGSAALEEIVGSVPQASVRLVELDLARQASVRRAAAELERSLDRLDVLVHNAGIMGAPFEVTEDGFELQFATNHLGAYALTGLLLELLLFTRQSRVISVSSAVHRAGRLPAEDPQRLRHGYRRFSAYATTKLANLLFAYELDRKLRAAGTEVRSLAAQPGWTSSARAGHGRGSPTRVAGGRLGRLARRSGRSPALGAACLLYAATAPGLVGGAYVEPAWAGLAGPPRASRSSATSYRRDLAERLWGLSEELTGVSYPFPQPSRRP